MEDMLKTDFDALAGRLERDRFAERLLFKLGAKRRARLGIVAFASGLGAAVAASQFTSMVAALAPALAETPPEMDAAGVSPHLLAAFILAGALAATALVLRQDF
ncbi:hypothetical protein CW354_16265 [Marinicaulis flavus]|uniref:Uncharacterized protein n=2 Tax=Hyphococcus luteus TaxID=2058213 RepID=A0A2S7K0B4_9PROT|nr:hypothetical protein CW354_16265 [Marinicaulis flavus]